MGINGYLVLVAALCCSGLALGAQIKDPTKHMSPQQRVVRSIPKLEDGEAPFVAVTRSGRLVERPIGELPGYTPPTPRCGANGVPIVDPPKRVAGYFKLNRTVSSLLGTVSLEAYGRGPGCVRQRLHRPPQACRARPSSGALEESQHAPRPTAPLL
jgi:hypothetical protein